MLIRLVCVAWLMVLAGCTPTRTFSIAVKNDTPRPMTVALTKDGPPFEKEWASPEDVEALRAMADEMVGVRALPPGRTAYIDHVTGHFEPGSRAILRIYGGDLLPSQMLKTSPGPNRVDVELKPGDNKMTAREENGALVVTPAGK